MSSPSWVIALGADDAGVDYKDLIKADLEKDPRVKAVIDCGVNKGSDDLKTAYPHVGVAAARKVASGEANRALLICGTGMGVAISANKVPGIRVSGASRGRGLGSGIGTMLTTGSCLLGAVGCDLMTNNLLDDSAMILQSLFDIPHSAPLHVHILVLFHVAPRLPPTSSFLLVTRRALFRIHPSSLAPSLPPSLSPPLASPLLAASFPPLAPLASRRRPPPHTTPSPSSVSSSPTTPRSYVSASA